ncbi:tetratricopeptide repeat protein [Deltaproteobacteria bacterium]|nr:tetratricopeptide repeat protein [Deltaproteobacteria bacterium]
MLNKHSKYHSNKYSSIIPFLLTGISFFLTASGVSAQCWTSDLSEEEQLAVARETYADGLYSASIETAKCYLNQFKESAAREEIFYLRVKALRKGGDIQASIKAFDEMKVNFPSSISYLDDEVLQRAIILIRTGKYPLAIKTLNSLLKDYPISKLRDEANYWLGYVTSINAELLRKKNKELAFQKYKNSIQFFKNSDPTKLAQSQRQERLYLTGRAWWFLNDIHKTEDVWQEYLKQSTSIKPEKALNIKHQLASKFQLVKKYEQAEKWFELIVTDHPNSKLASGSTFWRAEMAYNASLQRTGTADLGPKLVNHLVNNYKIYLAKKDKKYLPLTFYRIGVLGQKHQPKESIVAFQQYLSTKDKTYASEVQYRLAYLFIGSNQLKKAIDTFSTYLSTKDKTYADDSQYRLGYLYIETKKPKKAIETFNKYLKNGKGRHVVETQIRLGYLYIENKQLKKAIKTFEKYLASDDTLHVAEIQIRLGYLYVDTKQPKKAIKIFEKYLSSKDIDHVKEVQIRLGYLYIENKQLKKAIKIFEKYLASDETEHSLSIQLRLAFLYAETKQNFLAISLLEQVRLNTDYQNNPELLETLMVLYRETVSKDKFVQFLLSVKGNTKLNAHLRHRFQTQLLLTYFEQNKCKKLILEINDKPGYLQKSKNTNPEEWQHLQYIKSSCLLETKKWKEARIVSRKILDSDKYREQAIQILLESHKQLKDWKAITWEFQEIYDRKSPKMTIPYFQLWLFAAQRRTDFRRLERIQIIAERWKSAFPEDKQNMTEINLLISSQRLRELTAQENWKGISNFIRSEYKAGNISLDKQYFTQLLYAEKKLDNWGGILSVYALLREHDPQRTYNLDALIDQAEAAEKLGKKELSISFYRKASKLKPQTERDKIKQDEIRKYLAQDSFQKWIEKGDWTKITKAIHKEVREKKRILDEQNFELLIYAENKKSGSKRYNGILDAYALMAKYNKAKTQTVEALIAQGYAAEKLGGYKRAKGYYRNALKKVPDKNVNLVLQLVGELTRLYERSKDYKSLINTYERAYKVLKKSSQHKKEHLTFAYLIGYHQSSNLKQTKKARIWMMRADGGGISIQELQASFWVAQLDREANKTNKALKRLKELADRKIEGNSSMYVQIHFELGTLYHSKEKWKSALYHYRIVAKASVPAELKQFQNTAMQKAKEIEKYLKSIAVSK